MKKSITGAMEMKDNPALRFITENRTDEEAPQVPATEETVPAGYKLNPMYIEKKTKRLQLVMQPSLYEKVKAAAAASGTSVNDFCHRALEEATRKDN